MGGGTKHVPVLLDEIVSYLAPTGDEPCLLLDCTFGGGGHAAELLERFPSVSIIALDRDAGAVARGRERYQRFANRLQILHANFGDVTQVLARENAMINHLVGQLLGGTSRGQLQFNRILADLGISSDQLDAPERGFSFQGDGPLDMRLDQTQEVTAATLLNELSDRELKRLFDEGGVGYPSRTLAAKVIAARPFSTTAQFAAVCEQVLGFRKGKRGGDKKGGKPKHPATVPFQALRIAVNREFEAINQLLDQLPELLAPQGRAAIIAFHSLEDRLVARRMRDWELTEEVRDLPLRESERERGFGSLLTKKAVMPTEFEQKQNPRSRSARLRVFARN